MSGIGFSWVYSRALQKHGAPSRAMHDAAPFPKGGKPAVIVNETRLGGFLRLQQERLPYRPDLKQKARGLRTHMTDAEQLLWFHLRRKQMDGVQFFRQRPVGEVILDFYAPSIRLAIEVDGGRHFDAEGLARDRRRTTRLEKLGIAVIRFDNLQVLNETQVVLEEVHRIICDRKSPSAPSQALPL